MKNFKISALLISMMLSLSAWADGYRWLTFRMTDGTDVSVAAEDISIDYASGSLKLSSATVNQEIPVDKIYSMRFASELSGMDDVMSATDMSIDCFTLSGIWIGRYSSLVEARKALRSGVYIAKSDKKVIKLIF